MHDEVCLVHALQIFPLHQFRYLIHQQEQHNLDSLESVEIKTNN